jgi:hypothetical protein
VPAQHDQSSCSARLQTWHGFFEDLEASFPSPRGEGAGGTTAGEGCFVAAGLSRHWTFLESGILNLAFPGLGAPRRPGEGCFHLALKFLALIPSPVIYKPTASAAPLAWKAIPAAQPLISPDKAKSRQAVRSAELFANSAAVNPNPLRGERAVAHRDRVRGVLRGGDFTSPQWRAEPAATERTAALKIGGPRYQMRLLIHGSPWHKPPRRFQELIPRTTHGVDHERNFQRRTKREPHNRRAATRAPVWRERRRFKASVCAGRAIHPWEGYPWRKPSRVAWSDQWNLARP